jgi:hypothetical protein
LLRGGVEMADEIERTDEEQVEEKPIEDMDVPSEQAEDVTGGVLRPSE